MSRQNSQTAAQKRPPVIICVDDDHVIRTLYWQNLSLQGYRCMPCESAEAALEAVRQLPVSLAILDYDMPAVTGAELARQLRDLQPKLPIVLVSGRIDLESLDLEIFDEVHCKGSSPAMVYSAVASLLSRRRHHASGRHKRRSGARQRKR
jgi:DNA-binding NtrC family response regulator